MYIRYVIPYRTYIPPHQLISTDGVAHLQYNHKDIMTLFTLGFETLYTTPWSQTFGNPLTITSLSTLPRPLFTTCLSSLYLPLSFTSSNTCIQGNLSPFPQDEMVHFKVGVWNSRIDAIMELGVMWGGWNLSFATREIGWVVIWEFGKRRVGKYVIAT